MNKIFIILLFCTSFVFGQSVSDTLPALPYEQVFYNNFNIKDYGISNFNSGSRSFSYGNGYLTFTNGAGSTRGIILDYTNIASTEYVLEILVEDVSTGIDVYSQWSTLIGTITTNGWHTIKYVADASAGGFGNKLILAGVTGSAATSYKIGLIKLSKINTHRDILNETENIDSIYSVGNIYGNSFEANINGVGFFGVVAPKYPVTGAMQVTTASGGQLVSFGAGKFKDASTFDVVADITIVGGVPVYFQAAWGVAVTSDYVATTSGRHSFRMTRRGVQANATLNGLIAYCASGGTIRINSIRITEVGNNFLQSNDIVMIGKGTSYDAIGTSTENIRPQVAIGQNAYAWRDGVSIGYGSFAGNESLYNLYGAAKGGEVTAIGTEAGAWAWRTTAIGAESQALGQSSTALGSGAESYTSHGVAIGRGSLIMPYSTENNNTVSFESQSLFLGNGWAHKFPSPLSDQTRTELTPASTELKINGFDAFDARYNSWSAGTTYAARDVVYYSGNLYYSNAGGNIGNTPTVSGWTLWRSEPLGPASDFNKAGGHLALRAGRGTGTGEGGELRFYTAHKTGGTGSNAKNPSTLSMKLKSDSTIASGTDLWLLDRATSSVRRVVYHTKNAVVGTRNIVGFSKGLILE